MHDERLGGSSFTRRLGAAIAPALLVAVAVHAWFDHAQNLTSPWKGGGFGMFSSIDYPQARALRVTLVHAGQRMPIKVVCPFDAELSDTVAQELAAARGEPSDARLRQVAERLASLTFVRPAAMPVLAAQLGPELAPYVVALAPGAPIPKEASEVAFDGLGVAVYRYELATSALVAQPTALNRVRVEHEQR